MSHRLTSYLCVYVVTYSLRLGCHQCLIMAAKVRPMLVGTGIEKGGSFIVSHLQSNET